VGVRDNVDVDIESPFLGIGVSRDNDIRVGRDESFVRGRDSSEIDTVGGDVSTSGFGEAELSDDRLGGSFGRDTSFDLGPTGSSFEFGAGAEITDDSITAGGGSFTNIDIGPIDGRFGAAGGVVVEGEDTGRLEGEVAVGNASVGGHVGTDEGGLDFEFGVTNEDTGETTSISDESLEESFNDAVEDGEEFFQETGEAAQEGVDSFEESTGIDVPFF
jgi:hypothetical protein